MDAYECPVCGYVHGPDEAREECAFTDLPKDWRCPVCACEKAKFTVRETVKKVAPAEDAPCYICLVCGYRYEKAVGDPDHGAPAGTGFPDLPKDWTCPKCRAPKPRFAREG